MKRILITGGAGYIGSVVAHTLLEWSSANSVTVVDNLMYGPANLAHLTRFGKRFSFVEGDVRKTGRVSTPRTPWPLRNDETPAGNIRSFDVVIPLAAIVGAPACDLAPELAQEVNSEAVKALVLGIARHALVIFPNTNSGYGSTAPGAKCTEETPVKPLSLYARTKGAAESYLLSTVPNIVSLRLATVFGPSPRMRTDLLVNHFVHEAVRRGSLFLFEPEHRRNFVHIQDVAACIASIVDNPLPYVRGRIFNLGLDSANLTKRQLAEVVKQHFPKLQIAFDETGTKDPDQRDYVVSSEKLATAGFKAQRTLDDGIQELAILYSMAGRQPNANV